MGIIMKAAIRRKDGNATHETGVKLRTLCLKYRMKRKSVTLKITSQYKISRIDFQKSPEPAASFPMYISGVASSLNPQCTYSSKSKMMMKLDKNNMMVLYVSQTGQMYLPLVRKVQARSEERRVGKECR